MALHTFKPTSRGDFFQSISTSDQTTQINIASGEFGGHDDYLLVQIGPEDGPFKCAYLNEFGAANLIAALAHWMASHPDDL